MLRMRAATRDKLAQVAELSSTRQRVGGPDAASAAVPTFGAPRGADAGNAGDTAGAPTDIFGCDVC